VWTHVFYGSNPGYAAGKVNTSISLHVLGQNLIHPERMLVFYVPELVRWIWLAPILLVVLIVLAGVVGFRSGHSELVAATVAFTALILLTAAVADTVDAQPDLYESGSRFLLAMPLAVWLITHQTLLAGRGWFRVIPWARRTSFVTAAVVAGLAIVVGSEATAQARFRTEVASVSAWDLSPHAGVDLVRTAALTRQCTQTARTYSEARAQLIVSNFVERAFAYGCAALTGINTIYPVEDRRYWALLAAADVPLTRVLLQGGTDEFADQTPRAGRYVVVGDDLTLLLTPPRPLARSLKFMGVTVEPPRTSNSH
jgi:hypothetical protein